MGMNYNVITEPNDLPISHHESELIMLILELTNERRITWNTGPIGFRAAYANLEIGFTVSALLVNGYSILLSSIQEAAIASAIRAQLETMRCEGIRYALHQFKLHRNERSQRGETYA